MEDEMRHLISPLDFTVEELDQLLETASDIEKNPAKYQDACKGKRLQHYSMNQVQEHDLVLKQQ